MIARLKIEFIKLFSKKILPFLILFIIASFILVILGKSAYFSFCSDLEISNNIEEKRVTNYISYGQYSSLGTKLLFQPSPLIIFFANMDAVQSIESKLDTHEIVDINLNIKGKGILKRKESFFDYGGFLRVFGSFFMLYMGALTFKNRDYIFSSDRRFFEIAISRIIAFDSFFVVINIFAFLFVYLTGVPFTWTQIKLFTTFVLITLLYLNLSFVIGLALSSIFKKYLSGIVAAGVLWWLLVFGISQVILLISANHEISSDKNLNLKKTVNLLEFEQRVRDRIEPLLKVKKPDMENIKQIMAKMVRDYTANGYKKNKAMEQSFHDNLKANIKASDNLACYLPWSFYTVLQENISSKGHDAYLGFVEFVMEMRDGFYHFIYQKRYLSKDKKVTPFIPKGANVYVSKSKLPDRFLAGLISTVLWSLAFLLLAHWSFLRRVKAFDKTVFAVNPDRLPKDKNFFLLCKDKKDYEKCLNDKDEYPHVTMLADPSEIRYDPGVNWLQWIRFICCQENLKFSRVIDLLGLMEVTESKLKKKPQPEDQDLFKRIYLALKLAEPKHVYVFDNFLKRESPEFEEIFKKVLKNVAGKKLYVSAHPMTHLAEIEENLHTDGQIITIDITSPYYILR